MIKTKRNLIILMTFILLILALVFFYSFKIGNQEGQVMLSDKPALTSKEIYTVMLKALPVLRRYWEMGDFLNNLAQFSHHCPEYPSSPLIGKEFHQCNPHFMQCLFSGTLPGYEPEIEVKHNSKNYKIFLQPVKSQKNNFSLLPQLYQSIARSQEDGYFIPSKGIQVNLGIKEFPEINFALYLEDSCDQSYLPQGVYLTEIPFTVDKKKKTLVHEHSFKWDNYGRDIYIDKFLVSNLKILDWFAHQKKALPSIPVQDWMKSATFLNKKEQMEFCLYQGKRLMNTHFYDAATFLPLEVAQTVIHRFPWKEYTESPWLVSQIYPKESKFTAKEFEANCDRSFILNCDESKRKYYDTTSATWMGIYQTVGFEMESLDNLIRPFFNLEMSSLVFDKNNFWHLLGNRGHWNELSAEDSEIISDSSLGLNQNVQEIPTNLIGFRCYKELGGEW